MIRGMDYTLALTTAPTVEPVTNAEMDLWSRLAGDAETADSTLVDSLIEAARLHCETFTGRSFINTTYTMYLDSFPDVIYFPRSPLSSVTSIAYLDENGDSQTLGTSVYTVDADSEPGRVYLAYGQSWPATYAVPKAITIIFVAGYGATAASVPENIKAAIKQLAAHLYENREAVVIGTITSKLPFSVEALLSGERVMEMV